MDKRLIWSLLIILIVNIFPVAAIAATDNVVITDQEILALTLDTNEYLQVIQLFQIENIKNKKSLKIYYPKNAIEPSVMDESDQLKAQFKDGVLTVENAANKNEMQIMMKYFIPVENNKSKINIQQPYPIRKTRTTIEAETVNVIGSKFMPNSSLSKFMDKDMRTFTRLDIQAGEEWRLIFVLNPKEGEVLPGKVELRQEKENRGGPIAAIFNLVMIITIFIIGLISIRNSTKRITLTPVELKEIDRNKEHILNRMKEWETEYKRGRIIKELFEEKMEAERRNLLDLANQLIDEGVS